MPRARICSFRRQGTCPHRVAVGIGAIMPSELSVARLSTGSVGGNRRNDQGLAARCGAGAGSSVGSNGGRAARASGSALRRSWGAMRRDVTLANVVAARVKRDAGGAEDRTARAGVAASALRHARRQRDALRSGVAEGR